MFNLGLSPPNSYNAGPISTDRHSRSPPFAQAMRTPCTGLASCIQSSNHLIHLLSPCLTPLSVGSTWRTSCTPGASEAAST